MPSPRSKSGSSLPVVNDVVQSAKWLLLRLLRNASLSPPGNQLACESVAGLFVTCVRFLPSASATQMSALIPGRHLLSATLRPSEEKRGRFVRRLVSGKNGDGGPAASPFANNGMVQRLLANRFTL